MSYTVTEATVVFPDKKAASSFSSGYASKKPCAHIDCDLRAVSNVPFGFPCAWRACTLRTAPIFL